MLIFRQVALVQKIIQLVTFLSTVTSWSQNYGNYFPQVARKLNFLLCLTFFFFSNICQKISFSRDLFLISLLLRFRLKKKLWCDADSDFCDLRVIEEKDLESRFKYKVLRLLLPFGVDLKGLDLECRSLPYAWLGCTNLSVAVSVEFCDVLPSPFSEPSYLSS